ncbi:penicillin-binding protein 2 [Roseinatronobacter thiooxidans]|uniref:Penicillin-binding protein 2 n=1 Tax=Roseinatronobacter thiooxidans TaxID=121821 RepID=A0A2W7R1U5_9RHOB|nr:penicillin-binding protein 2 [Roseinatronobacter thiooxidans]PZX48089.1 penicillin-binding protein 2 [Roseinatronobacter thiooxidans]
MKRSEREQEHSRRIISRRGLLLGGVQLGVAGALFWRLRDMQLNQSEQFRLLADENRINLRLLPPTRGLILDRNGVLLAGNEQNYRVVIKRDDAGDIDLVLSRLARLIPLSEDDIERARRDMLRNRPFVPVTVAERLSWEEISRVASNAPALPGVTPEMGLSRFYPLREDTAHVVGYVGPVSERDLEALETPDPVLMIPRFQIGKSGVERMEEDRLRGRAGSQRVEVNAVGRVMRELDRVEGTPGGNVHLTLDARLQNYALERLHGQSAAAVVLDVESGDILALASGPSFDPNLFVRGISTTNFNSLLENDYRPLLNKTVQGMYPPGSTFKMVTALAALEAGVTDGQERVFCPGHMDVSGNRFHCWKRGGHGRVDLVSALAESCDVYMYEIAQRCGIDKINEMSTRLGLGIRYELPITSVSAGLNPTREWKRNNRNAEWRIGDTVNASIGQGFVLSTPLQLAVMTARLASNKAILPRLIRDPSARAEQQAASLDLRPEWLRMIRRGMSDTVNDRRGTAYSSRVVAEGQLMAGKTGTSQVFSITRAERDAGVRRQEDLPWNRRNHGLFVSYAPFDAPRVAVAVVVEHGGGGSSAAAPIGRDITLAALNDGMPPLSAYPAPQRNRIHSEQQDMQERLRRPEDMRISRA